MSIDQLQKFSIPTSYRGVQMRSKLEAKWAEWFDTHSIPWIYEPQGYCVDGMPYLPDFYLPREEYFFEVKGVMDDVSMRKVTSLAIESASVGISTLIGFDLGVLRIHHVATSGENSWVYETDHEEIERDIELHVTHFEGRYSRDEITKKTLYFYWCGERGSLSHCRDCGLLRIQKEYEQVDGYCRNCGCDRDITFSGYWKDQLTFLTFNQAINYPNRPI